MIFSVTDNEFNKICSLNKAINIQWIQRWYACGQFSIQVPANSVEVTVNWHYLVCDERPNIGIIQQKIYSRNIKGNFLQISGYFMEFELSNVIIEHYTLKPVNTPVPNAFDYLHRRIGKMIETFISENDSRFYYNDETSENNPNKFGKYTDVGSQTYRFEINNQDVMSAAYELSKTNETSFIYTLYEDFAKRLKMLPSVENTNIIFTEDQLENYTVTYDESNYKNCVKILGPTLNGKQIIHEYKYISSDDDTEKWILLDNTGMSLTRTVTEGGLTYEENITDESEIQNMMETNAKAELEKYKKVVNVDVKIANTGKYVYNKDFYIGDIITVKIESLGIEESRQIIEVSEVWKTNKHEVYLELGESRQTTIDKAKRAISQGSISKIISKIRS